METRIGKQTNNVRVYPANAENFRLSFLADPIDPNTRLSETFLQFFKTDGDDIGFNIIEEYKTQKRYLEALEVRVESSEGFILWQGFADLSNIENTFTCDFYSIRLIEVSSNILDRFDDLGLILLEKKGKFLDSDYVPIKIANLNIPDGNASLFTSFAIYTVSRELIDVIFKISNPVTAANGIAYGIAMLPTLVDLINSLRDTLIPDARYYRGVRLVTIFEAACDYLGLTFESTIFEDADEANRVWIPRKDFEPVANIGNATDRGIPDITFGQFKNFVEKYYNARIKIVDNVMRFERWDYYTQDSSGVVLPELLPEQSGYRTNLAELSQTYIIDIARDETDRSTINNTGGYLMQSFVDIPTSNQQSLSLKGANIVNIEYSRGHRYNNTSDFEDQFIDAYNSIVGTINTIAGLLNTTTSLQTIDSRLGAMQLSDFRFNTDKIVVIEGDDLGNLTQDNDNLTSAIYLYDNFHSINSIINNQWLIVDALKLPLDINDAIAVRDNNYVNDSEGNVAQIEENTRDNDAMHVIKYRIKKDYLSSSLVEEIEELS
jgi:hypothetical protein